MKARGVFLRFFVIFLTGCALLFCVFRLGSFREGMMHFIYTFGRPSAPAEHARVRIRTDGRTNKTDERTIDK